MKAATLTAEPTVVVVPPLPWAARAGRTTWP